MSIPFCEGQFTTVLYRLPPCQTHGYLASHNGNKWSGTVWVTGREV